MGRYIRDVPQDTHGEVYSHRLSYYLQSAKRRRLFLWQVKYGINKEVIWLWADMKRFPMSYEKGITTVDGRKTDYSYFGR